MARLTSPDSIYCFLVWWHRYLMPLGHAHRPILDQSCYQLSKSPPSMIVLRRQIFAKNESVSSGDPLLVGVSLQPLHEDAADCARGMHPVSLSRLIEMVLLCFFSAGQALACPASGTLLALLGLCRQTFTGVLLERVGSGPCPCSWGLRNTIERQRPLDLRHPGADNAPYLGRVVREARETSCALLLALSRGLPS